MSEPDFTLRAHHFPRYHIVQVPKVLPRGVSEQSRQGSGFPWSDDLLDLKILVTTLNTDGPIEIYQRSSRTPEQWQWAVQDSEAEHWKFWPEPEPYSDVKNS